MIVHFVLVPFNMNYTGESLQQFIDFERSREREERARQREEVRERLEAEKELVDKQLKLESLKKENAAEGHIGQSSRSCAPAPRLPEFK